MKTIRPGEDGVTGEHIKLLHALDDSDVYYNGKNLKPKRTDEEKAAIKEWRKEYIRRETKYRGYPPTEDEVDEAEKEQFPKNYNLSLDFDFGECESGTKHDKDDLHYRVAQIVQRDASPETLSVRELITQMTDKQRTVITLKLYGGYNFTEISKLIGISVKNVKKHYDNALKYIKENF